MTVYYQMYIRDEQGKELACTPFFSEEDIAFGSGRTKEASRAINEMWDEARKNGAPYKLCARPKKWDVTHRCKSGMFAGY